MAQRVHSVAAQPTTLGVVLAFCGMFAVGSLLVQLVATSRQAPLAERSVDPVVAHPSTLWNALGER